MSFTARDRVNRIQTAMELTEHALEAVSCLQRVLQEVNTDSLAQVHQAVLAVGEAKLKVDTTLTEAQNILSGVQW